MTELLPPSNPSIRAYTYTVCHSTSSPCLTSVLALCQHVAKETLKEHYKRLQSDPSASEEYSFVYESTSEVVLQNNQVVVLEVESRELKENTNVEENCKDNGIADGLTCATIQSETNKGSNEVQS